MTGIKLKLFNIFVLFIFIFFNKVYVADASIVTYPVKQVIIYQSPVWASTNVALTSAEIASKETSILYARNQMQSNLANYKNAGFTGNAIVYLMEDAIAGPGGLDSTTAQRTLCTTAQKSTSVFSNTATMDTGDFCEIHDAIVGHTSLRDYPDIFPTENWFIHKPGGARYINAGSGAYRYHPNPADPNWRTYFARRALRELSQTDPTHPSIPGTTGLFIDNLELSWTHLLQSNNNVAPNEFSSESAYLTAVAGFVQQAHNLLHSSVNNFPVWANMISDRNTGTSWNQYSAYLEGGMAESFGLSWGTGPLSQSTTLNQLTQAESWIASGKHYIAVAQSDAAGSYHAYTLGLYLLVTDGVHASYKYSNYTTGNYSLYYEIPQYYYQLGAPTGNKTQINSSPLVYKRNFVCGNVTVDLTNHTANINYTTGCRPTSSPSPSPTSLIGDINGDRIVNILDYTLLANAFGTNNTASDLNHDGTVNILDYTILSNNFGRSG